MNQRPKIKIELTKRDRKIEALCQTMVFVIWILTVFDFLSNQASFTTNLNLDNTNVIEGVLSFFALPLFTSIYYVLLTLINKYPHLHTYSSEIALENTLNKYNSSTIAIRYIKFAIILICLMIAILMTFDLI